MAYIGNKSGKNTALTNLISLAKYPNQTVLILNASSEDWGRHQIDCTTLLHDSTVSIDAEALVGDKTSQWVNLANALQEWDSTFANWLCEKAHDTEETLPQLPEQLRQAAERSGRCIILIKQAHLLHTRYPNADWEHIAAQTQQAFAFVMIGDESLKGLNMNGYLDATQCDTLEYHMTFHQMCIYLTAIGVVAEEEIHRELYDITRGWAFAVVLLGPLLKHGQPLTGADIDQALTQLFRKFDTTMFSMDVKESKMAILLAQFESFSYRMAVEVSPYSESVVKRCLELLPGIQYTNKGSNVIMHPLIRNYLETKIFEVPKKMRDSCLQRAIVWYLGKKNYLDVLRYSVKIQDYGNVRTALRLMNMHKCYRESEEIISLLSEIPSTELCNHPMIWAYKVVALFVAKDYILGADEKKRLESYLASHCDSKEQKQARGEMYALNGFMDFCLPNCSEEFKLAKQYLGDTSEIWNSRYCDFVAQGTALYFAEGSGRSLYESVRGQIDVAPHIYNLFNNWGRGYEYLGLSEYYYLTGDDNAVLENANKAIQEAMAYRQWDVASVANYVLTAQHIMKGRFEDALYTWRNVHQLATQKKNPDNHMEDLVDFTVYSITGQIYLAADWIRDDRPPSLAIQEYEPGRGLFARCVYATLKQDYVKALSMIDDALGRTSVLGQWCIGTRLLVLKLMVLAQLQKTASACAILCKIYKEVSQYSCATYLAEYGKQLNVLPVLWAEGQELGMDMPPRKWIYDIISLGKAFEANKKAFNAAYYEKLQEGRALQFSQREYIILQMACLGYGKKEIAAYQGVSTKYIAAVMNKICSKLNVDTVKSAITLGRSMGMQNDDLLLVKSPDAKR